MYGVSTTSGAQPRLLVITLLLIVLAGHLVVASAAAQDIRISEALSDPATDWDGDGEVDIKSDEWVEIANVSGQTISLDHYYLRDATGDAYHYGFTGSLIPGQARVVTGTHAQIWQASNGGGTSGLSLNNGGDRLELWYDDGVDPPILVDVMMVPPHAAATDRTLALDIVANVYVLHDGLSPYGGNAVPEGTGCLPSPGVAGTCDSSVSVDEESWGQVKFRFQR